MSTWECTKTDWYIYHKWPTDVSTTPTRWYTSTSNKLDLQDWNFEIMKSMGEHETVDFINVVINDLPLWDLLAGNITPSQMQEQNRQVVQDALDQIF